MIISHSHKFIFFRPKKVGSTAVHHALEDILEEKDIVSNKGDYSKISLRSSSDRYPFRKNKRATYSVGNTHAFPLEEKHKIKMWDKYSKITIVRNPWDTAISFVYWEKFKGKKYEIKTPLAHWILKSVLNDLLNNVRYCFDDECHPIMDFYLRYEHLQEDYNLICDKLNIPKTKLKRFKDKSRFIKRHYPYYYDEETEEFIRKKLEHYIDYFNYSFSKLGQ